MLSQLINRRTPPLLIGGGGERRARSLGATALWRDQTPDKLLPPALRTQVVVVHLGRGARDKQTLYPNLLGEARGADTTTVRKLGAQPLRM